MSSETPAHVPQIHRLPVERPQPAVDFLHANGGGVMDLLAHFWERLAQTPPLARPDLHLVMARNVDSSHHDASTSSCVIRPADIGAMLYVPKARRADVLATDPAAATAFTEYVARVEDQEHGEAGKASLNFITGEARGIVAMLPPLLARLHRKQPAKAVTNVVMECPAEVAAEPCPEVRLAQEADLPVLQRWRKLYKEERGLLFDADLDAWVRSQRVFVCEHQGAVVSLAKFDLVLGHRVEIGGVFTLPEARSQGHGRRILGDLVHRIRSRGLTPTLQVDRDNTPAVTLYQHLGWKSLGELSRVWLAHA